MKKLNLSHITTNLLGIFSLLFIYWTTVQVREELKRPKVDISNQESVINFNEKFIKPLTLGQSRLLSSLLWAEVLIKAGTKHYEGNDLGNWMFLRLKLITTLDPYFYEAYLYGGVYLSIVHDDDYGAEFIYDRALKYYPKDLRILLNSSFHYYFELGKAEKASLIMEKILELPNPPPHIPSLLARIKASLGKLEDAYKIVKLTYDNVPDDSPLKEGFKVKLNNIQTEIDLKCLNNNEIGCNFTNLYGEPYQRNAEGKFYSARKWEPYRTKKKAPPKAEPDK